jgi:3-oxoacid CoA-transferase
VLISPQAEEIVPVGTLEPNQVHLPGIYVDRIVKATTDQEIEFLTTRNEENTDDVPGSEGALGHGEARTKRERIAKVRNRKSPIYSCLDETLRC